MLKVDSCVDHRYVHIDAVIVDAVDPDLQIVVRKDSLNARRDGLCKRMDLLIQLDVGDAGVSRQGVQASCGHHGGNTSQSVPIGVLDAQPVGLGQVGYGGIHVDLIVKDHNVAGDSAGSAKHLATLQLLQ
ncbi:MAG TPA: hypothetical protein VMM76_11125 [Pirellulaceae bacterium]|nr:hypothetical protein [Pirellulaceae bacterium]